MPLLYPFIAIRDYYSDTLLGMLMGAAGLGSISGALLAATVYRQRQRGPLLLGNAIVFSVFLVIFAFTPWFHVALPLLVVTGASHTGYTVLTNTLIQTLTPRNLRGRVMSVYFLDRGIMPLGTLLAGTMAGAIGAPWTIGLMAMGGLVVPLWIAISNQHIRKLQ